MMSIAYDHGHEATPIAASRPKLLLIDGQLVPSLSGRTFQTLNPATEQVIATIAEGNEADVDRAVAAARRAFEGPWSRMRAAERGHILFKLVELMKQHADEIAVDVNLDGILLLGPLDDGDGVEAEQVPEIFFQAPDFAAVHGHVLVVWGV